MAVCLLVPLKYYRASLTNPTELVIKIRILSQLIYPSSAAILASRASFFDDNSFTAAVRVDIIDI